MRKRLTREQLIARLDAKLERRKVQNETRSLERKVANEAMKEYGKGYKKYLALEKNNQHESDEGKALLVKLNELWHLIPQSRQFHSIGL